MTLLDVAPFPGGNAGSILGSALFLWSFLTIIMGILAVVILIVIKVARRRKNSKNNLG